MKETIEILVGVVLMLAMVLAVGYIGSWFIEGPGAKERAERQRFCAMSPDQREAAIWTAWQQERVKPGSPWATYQELNRHTRSRFGC